MNYFSNYLSNISANLFVSENLYIKAEDLFLTA